MHLNFDKWNMGTQGAFYVSDLSYSNTAWTTGPLAIGYPATMQEAELKLQEVCQVCR